MADQDMVHEYLDLMAQVVGNVPFNKVQEYSRGEMMSLRFLEVKEGRGEPVTPGDISQALGLTTARIANVLNSLEKKGLVARVHDVEDRRRVFVTLTEDGRAFVHRKSEEIGSAARGFLESLGEKDARELLRLLRRMVEYRTSRDIE